MDRWFVFLITNTIKNTFTAMVNWFSPPHYSMSDNEVGAFVNRHQMPVSWVDRVISAWVNQPAFHKVMWIGGVSLIGGGIGLFTIGAPFYVMLASSIVSLFVHGICVSHEKNRLERSLMMSEEARQLTKRLDNSQTHIESVGSELTAHAKTMQQLLEPRSLEAKNIENKIHALEKPIAAVGDKTTSVHHSIKGIEKLSQDLEADVNQYHQNIKDSTSMIQKTETSLQRCQHQLNLFTNEAKNYHDTQQQLSQAVNELRLAVAYEPQNEDSSALPYENEGHDIDALLDECEQEKQYLLNMMIQH